MTVTIGSQTYFSLATVIEADYWLLASPRYGVKWAASTSDAKGAALVEATRVLTGLSWNGTATGAEVFPRSGLVDKDGREVSSTEIPEEVVRACALLAGAIIDKPDTREVKSARAGDAEVRFFKGTAPTRYPVEAFDIVSAFTSGGAYRGGRVFRGKHTILPYCCKDL
jgi:hypothetical protein